MMSTSESVKRRVEGLVTETKCLSLDFLLGLDRKLWPKRDDNTRQ